MARNIAFVIDALPGVGGSERVLLAALERYPAAPVHTLVYNAPAFAATPLSRAEVHASWVQNLPLALRHYRSYLPVLPFAIEGMDLREFETIVSIHYAFAHGVRLEPAQRHFSYVCTPLRYAWRRKGSNMPGSALAHWAGGLVFRRTRRWDRRAAQRVTSYAAVSRWAAANVQSAFGRNARVIYPPVQVERFDLAQKREGYFLVVSRLVRHKRVDVVVRAFSQLRELPLVVVGEGPERPVLERIATPNVHFLGYKADPEVAVLMSRARAFVHAGEEDFGIALVEAQAAGCPVITYAGGAARESVSPALHNLLFEEQSPESLLEALQCFMQRRDAVSRADLTAHATRFRTERFQEEFCEWMQKS